MPLAALTPVLNDLLHKGGNSPSSTPQNQTIQQIPTSNDSSNNSEYIRRGSSIGQSTSINPLSSTSVDDVSIE